MVPCRGALWQVWLSSVIMGPGVSDCQTHENRNGILHSASLLTGTPSLSNLCGAFTESWLQLDQAAERFQRRHVFAVLRGGIDRGGWTTGKLNAVQYGDRNVLGKDEVYGESSASALNAPNFRPDVMAVDLIRSRRPVAA